MDLFGCYPTALAKALFVKDSANLTEHWMCRFVLICVGTVLMCQKLVDKAQINNKCAHKHTFSKTEYCSTGPVPEK